MDDVFNHTAAVPTSVAYYDPTNYVLGQASNAKLSEISLKILQCPDDNTVQVGQGNLSYVVNGGFALWHAVPIGWVGSTVDGGAHRLAPSIWAPSATTFLGTIGTTQKLGVMFIESSFPQGTSSAPRIPWNVRSSLTSIVDGASNTILLSENTLTGAGTPTPYSDNLVPNWAARSPPSPRSSARPISAAPRVAGTSLDCTAGSLTPSGDNDGFGWSMANKVGTLANINGGQNLTIEGSYPFSNSAHPAGLNLGFCDGGIRFISNTIDGTVYSKIITPAGSKLPLYCKQLPVEQDAFVSQ